MFQFHQDFRLIIVEIRITVEVVWLQSKRPMIDFNDSHLHWTATVICLCPLIWNLLGRLCFFGIPKQTPMYQRHIMCYLLMLWIFSFSSYRDYLIRETISKQQQLVLDEFYVNVSVSLAMILFVVGQLFVLSSFYKLGITGTFLGDYCGILMETPVQTFPFNFLDNPMYLGSTLSFLALAFYYRSPIGFLLTFEIYLVYQIALRFEEPFTKSIYEQKNK